MGEAKQLQQFNFTAMTDNAQHGEIVRAVREVAGRDKLEVYGSGRTDAGVHALAQVAHLDVATPLLVGWLETGDGAKQVTVRDGQGRYSNSSAHAASAGTASRKYASTAATCSAGRVEYSSA